MSVKLAADLIQSEVQAYSGAQDELRFMLRKRTATVHIPQKGATPTDAVGLLTCPKDLRLTNITLYPSTTQADDANLSSLVFRIQEADGSFLAGSTQATMGGGYTAGTTIDKDSGVTAAGTFGIQVASAGSTLIVDYTTQGTGATIIPATTVTVEYELA